MGNTLSAPSEPSSWEDEPRKDIIMHTSASGKMLTKAKRLRCGS